MNEQNQEVESVTTLSHSDVKVSTEQRQKRALILDAKLDDALLESFIYMAEIVDDRLYEELGYDNARDYFKAKELEVRQVYRYAQIGRLIKPHLDGSDYKRQVAGIGSSKLQLLASKLDDQIEHLMKDGKIVMGGEEYTAEELQTLGYRDIIEQLKKTSKRVDDYEVVQEQKKNAELERDHLKKEIKELKEFEEKHRERSQTADKIESDIDIAEKAFQKFYEAIDRIDAEKIPERLEVRLSVLIERLRVSDENFREKFIDLMLKHNDVV